MVWQPPAATGRLPASVVYLALRRDRLGGWLVPDGVMH